MKTAMAITNSAVIILDFLEPVDGFVDHPGEDHEGQK
jgi:hypothetical protein